jgi:hypothetical protein
MARFGKSELQLSNTISTLVTELNNIADDLGNIDNISDSNVIDAIGTLQTNINNSDSDIGTRTDLATTDQRDLVRAINEIHGVITPFDISLDTSPQLGGDLDLNSSDITGTGNINITGTITSTGTVDFGSGSVTTTGTVTTGPIAAGSSNITTTGNIAGPVTQLTAATVALGSWTITTSGTNLIFSYSGTPKVKIASNGDITSVGDVIAEGTI